MLVLLDARRASPSSLFLPFDHFESPRFSLGMQHDVVRWKEKSWCWSRHEFRCWGREELQFATRETPPRYHFSKLSLGRMDSLNLRMAWIRQTFPVCWFSAGWVCGLVWCVPKMRWKNLGIFAAFAKAFDLEEEVLSHLREHGDCDMGALRQAGHRGHPTN